MASKSLVIALAMAAHRRGGTLSPSDVRHINEYIRQLRDEFRNVGGSHFYLGQPVPRQVPTMASTFRSGLQDVNRLFKAIGGSAVVDDRRYYDISVSVTLPANFGDVQFSELVELCGKPLPSEVEVFLRDALEHRKPPLVRDVVIVSELMDSGVLDKYTNSEQLVGKVLAKLGAKKIGQVVRSDGITKGPVWAVRDHGKYQRLRELGADLNRYIGPPPARKAEFW